MKMVLQYCLVFTYLVPNLDCWLLCTLWAIWNLASGADSETQTHMMLGNLPLSNGTFVDSLGPSYSTRLITTKWHFLCCDSSGTIRNTDSQIAP